MESNQSLADLAKKIRRGIMISTTAAQSGHPTSSLSGVELMASLLFGGYFTYDLDKPDNFYNDRLIFSKGHASPLLYSLYYAAGVVSEDELRTLRQIDSALEGHPIPRFKYVDVATGSLGQGLSLGLGMALGIKLRNKIINKPTTREQRVYTLLGDSETAEGQVWEALQVASFHKVNNLIGILDVNRLGQSRETMLQWDLSTYTRRFQAFGWNVITIEDGNDLEEVENAFEVVNQILDGKLSKRYSSEMPTMLVAKTVKGKGLKFWENLNGFHSKQVKPDELPKYLDEIGDVPAHLNGVIKKPEQTLSISEFNISLAQQPSWPSYPSDAKLMTKEASGDALLALGKINANIVVLDGEVSNSTHTEKFRKEFPDRAFEMFIAEQNMVSAAVGLSKMGFVPVVATFSAFMSRAFDQIRMAQYSNANLKLFSSYAGVSSGMDGASGMGLEDVTMMRGILNSVILQSADANSTLKLSEQMMLHSGISYLRLTREKSPNLYPATEEFKIGGSKTIKSSSEDKVTLISVGITLHEALKAAYLLAKDNISVAVIDAYSIKPLDRESLRTQASKTGKVVVVEDHYRDGALGDAVAVALSGLPVEIIHLSANKIARSGKPADTLKYEEIDSAAIIAAVKKIVE